MFLSKNVKLIIKGFLDSI